MVDPSLTEPQLLTPSDVGQSPPVAGKPEISVVVPVYLNSGTLAELHRRMEILFSQVELDGTACELILVDDGSSDDSWAVMEKIQGNSTISVLLVKLSRNFGQYAATVAGWSAASGDCVVTISADLQDPVELIGDMVASWRHGSEVVLAHRQQRSDGWLSRATSSVAYGVARRSLPHMPSGGFDFYLLSRRAVNLLLEFKGRNRFGQGDILYLGLPMTLIPYERLPRPNGKSGYSWSARAKYFTDLLLDATYIPIQLISRTGIVVAVLGLLYAVLVVIARLRNDTPFPGWAPIMVVALVIGGLIMIMLGVIGEYLWRIYDDIRGRPLFIVERALRSEVES